MKCEYILYIIESTYSFQRWYTDAETQPKRVKRAIEYPFLVFSESASS